MPQTPTTKPAPTRALLAAFLFAFALIGGAVAVPGAATGAPDVGALNDRIENARSEARSLAAQIDAQEGRLAVVQQEANAAQAREQELTDLLASAATERDSIRVELAEARVRLAEGRRHLRRTRAILSKRLVAIYKQGQTSSVLELLASGSGFEDLVSREQYVSAIEEADSDLAKRAADLADQIEQDVAEIEQAEAGASAYADRLDAARKQVAGARDAATSKAAQLSAAEARQEASLSELRSNVGNWTKQVQKAEEVTVVEAQQQVAGWVGDYAIPAAIVMCESGGNYSALNPSSGAGGAYQILPSTWALYGGKGLPHEASKAEQDRIAALIWRDSGASAWVCAG